MNELLRDAAMRAASYLDGLDARKVAPDPDAVAPLDALDTPLPAEGCDPARVDSAIEDMVWSVHDG